MISNDFPLRKWDDCGFFPLHSQSVTGTLLDGLTLYYIWNVIQLLLLQQLCKKTKYSVNITLFLVNILMLFIPAKIFHLKERGGGGVQIFWSGFKRLKDTFQLETSWLPAIPARQTPAWPACEISLRDLRQISLGCFKQDFQQRIICLPLFVVKSQACLSLYIHLFGFSSFQTLNITFSVVGDSCCWSYKQHLPNWNRWVIVVALNFIQITTAQL